MSKSRRGYRTEPIAIIGSGLRFPGEANTPSKLWDLLREPRDVQSEIPDDRFHANGFYHPQNDHHGTSNIKHSYLLSEDHRQFDAQFFGIKPVEANSIDPQQRMLLETVFEGVEAAGLDMESLRGSPTAVYVGLMCADYADLLGRDPSFFPTYFATGTARSIISNRISYFFDWHGPSMTIDTACSSSLVAVHQAVQTLRTGESRVAVAAGANLLLGPEQYIAESNLKMLSPTGRSHMWSEKADGYARGEGIACVVLKTLSAALEDGDDVECLIVETGINQDGKTKGITMPSATAQAALIEATYKKAGLDLRKPADRPQYFEAHGTGTPAGDPIEAEAIATAFFANNSPSRITGPLFVGSIKTVIGHTEGTAGLAGLLKASLALKHSTIPPNMLFENLAPAVKPFYTNLEIATKAKPWPTTEGGAPRRASLNSFGFGGANAHCILENWDSPEPDTEANRSVYTPFTFSAISEKALAAVAASYVEFLIQNPSVNLSDLAYTLSQRRSRFPFRMTVSARDVSSLCSGLQRYVDGNGNKMITPISSGSPIRILGVFTGQGAQWAGMVSKMFDSPAVLRIVDQLEQSLSELPDSPDWSLKAELLANKDDSRIGEAKISQPTCTAVQIIAVDMLRAAGIDFSAVVGHSSGEIGAAYAAGYLSATDAIRIAYYRGLHLRLAQGTKGEEGAMIAVGTSYEDAKAFCNLKRYRGKVCVAASNSATSVTISGDASAIQSLGTIFSEEEKKFARVLRVDKAYHSHHMNACSEAYLKSLRACGIKAHRPSRPDCLWVSSVYHKDIADVQDDLNGSYWNSNLVSPVMFSQALEYALGESRYDFAIEVGPHPALKGPALQVIQAALGETLPYTGVLSRNTDDVEAFADGLGYIWASFGEEIVDFVNYERMLSGGHSPKLLKNLPRYPWDHQRSYWHESRISKSYRTREPMHELLGHRSPHHSEHQVSWTNYLIPRELPWITGHRIQGQMVFPAAGYMSTAFEAARILAGEEAMQLIELTDFTIGQPLVFDTEDSSVEIQASVTDIRRQGCNLTAKFSYYSISNKEPGPMMLNASGGMRISFGERGGNVLRSMPEADFAMLDVEQDRFYDSFAGYGYGYTGPFKALKSMQRKLGIASGSIEVPEASQQGKLLIHPAPLDAAIQSILLAYCFPGDGRLASIQLPTDISSITIDPSQALNPSTAFELRFVSTIGQDDGKRIEGDVDLFPADGSSAVVQLEGLHTKPMVPPTEDTDAHIFSEVAWDTASPNAMLVASTVEENFDFGFTLERVAYYYLRNLDEKTTAVERETCEWYHKSLYNFADTMLARVADGTHPYAKRDWINDRHEDITAIIESHPESIDLRIMHAVGENIVSVVRGELPTILEPMRQDNMLNDFYVTGLGMEEYLAKLTATAKQIGHRHPTMNVLEIGAGTGGATKSILRELDEAFASYTYTDISAGFFEEARQVFKERESKMVFKTLDIEKDVLAQGYAENSYDLVIASLVLHATEQLDRTMANVRRLLKPGGYLLMLEITDNEQMRFGFIFGGLPGWWLGHEDGRPLSPCIEAPAWDELLKKHGFAGIDSMAPHKTTEPLPLCVMLGQAVDSRIDFLRDPLASTEENVNISQITTVGGASAGNGGCLLELASILRNKHVDATQVPSVADLTTVNLPFGGTVVCLQDHDVPIFENLDADLLKGVQNLFEQSKNILWVTRGYKQGNPYAKMMIAFARCIVQEMPHIRVQFLDFDQTEEPDAHLISACLLRFLIAEQWDDQNRLKSILWSVEPEVSCKQGLEFIPRVKLSKRLNDRYNSSRRSIVEFVDPSEVPLKLTYVDEGFVLKASPSQDSGLALAGDLVVQVTHSVASAVKVGPSAYFYLVLGTAIGSKRQVMALTSTASSRVTVPQGLVRTSSLPVDQAVPQLVATWYALMAQAALADLSRGDCLVVVQPDSNLALAIDSLATTRGVQTLFVAAEALQHEQFSAKVINPRGPKREILKLAGVTVSRVVECQRGDESKPLSRYFDKGAVIDSLDSYSRWESSKGPIHSISEASKCLDQAQLQLLLTTSTTDMKDIVVESLAGIQEQSLVSPGTIVDWTISSAVPMQLEPVDARPLFRSDRSYWLVGLTGSLGLSLCQWMISRGARYIAISSRNPKVDERWLAQFASLSATVQVYANDVTDRESVRKTYAKIQNDLPAIAGVCQGAMVLQDTLFLDLDMQRMNKVLKPKVDGAKYLDEIFQHQPLDFFIMLSSMAAVTGNPGQAAYAAANMFLAGLAAQRRQRGVAASTVNIGAIIGNGYVTRELTLAQQVALQKVGNMWMSEQDFHQIFAEAVVASPPCPGPNPEYCTGLRVYYADEDEHPKFANDPVFSHLMRHRSLGGPIAGDSVAVVSVKIQLAQANTAEEVSEIMKESLTTKLQAALEMSPDVDVAAQNADSLGIDSLVAVDLRSWFLKELNVDMPVLKIISGATIGELLERAQELLDPAMTPALGTEVSAEKKAALEKAKAKMHPATEPEPEIDIKAESNKAFVPEVNKEKLAVTPGAPQPMPKPKVPAKTESSTSATRGTSATAPMARPSALAALTAASSSAEKISPAPQQVVAQIPRQVTARPLPAQTQAKSPHLAATKRMNDIQETTPAKTASGPALLNSTLTGAQSEYTTSSAVSSEELHSGSRSVQSLSTRASTPSPSRLHTKQVSSTSLSSSFEELSPDSVRGGAVQRIVPMSFGQARFWFLQSYLQDPTTYNVTVSIHLDGSLQVNDLAQAVATVGQRHESLRTKFSTNHDNQPVQTILESSVLRLERKDVSTAQEVKEEYRRLCNHVYDLENGESLRIILITLSPVSHQILLGYHHINMDGVSFEVFFSDLEKAYNTRSAINGPVLQYPDFALKQRQAFVQGKWGSELDHWKRQFSVLPAPIPLLPMSKSLERASLTKYASHVASHRISTELSASVNETCKKMKVSPFQFYLAVYKVLMTRLANVDDLCIGVADANRNDPDQQNALGCYLNLLPIRFDNSASTFSEALKDAKTRAQQAFANSKVPFDILLKELNVPRSSHYSPLFQVFLNYRQGVAEKRTFAGCASSWDDFDGGRIAYDLSLDVVDNAGGNALLRLFAQTELYSEHATDVMLKSFVSLLEAFVKNPAARVTRPALYADDDARKALTLGLGPDKPLTWQGTLVDRIDDMVKNHGSSPAVGDGLGAKLTYSEMAQRAMVIATALKDTNIKPGAHVGVFQDASVNWICSLLAVMRSGCIYIPLDPRASIPRLASIVQDCQPAAILTDDITESQLPELKASGKAVNVSRLPFSGRETKSPNLSDKDSPMAILYTSGSTGKPKGIELPHRVFCAHVETVTSEWISGITNPVGLQQSSFNFDMSLVQIFWPLCSGGRVFVAPQSARGDPVAISRILTDEKISITAATPSEYSSWLEYGSTAALQQSNWSLAIAGGEKMTDNLVKAFSSLRIPSLRVMNCYGPTEVTFFSHFAEVELQQANPGHLALKPWFNVSSYIVDFNLNPVPAGVSGELLLAGMGVATGYHNAPESSSTRFMRDPHASPRHKSMGWISMHATGDRGTFTPDGTLQLEGRVAGDTQIKLHGLRIDLQEIEQCMVQASGGVVLHAVVSVRPMMASALDTLVAHVEFASAKRPTDSAAFTTQLLNELPLPQYMRPSVVVPIDQLPRTVSGKIDRLAAQALHLPHSSQTKSSNLSENRNTETQLLEIWRDILTREVMDNYTVDASSDFFQVGGTSMLLVALRARLQKDFEVDLPLVELFDHSTLGRMAARLQGPVTVDPITSTAVPETPATTTSDQTTQRATKPLAPPRELIDWDVETAPAADLVPSMVLGGNEPRIVILTGATGFLGLAILQRLIDAPSIRRIYCIAIRQEYTRTNPLFSSPKVVVHKGDQSLPLLGLARAEVTPMLNEADAIIHNGADVSFLKSYHSVRPVNVQSTKQLAHWAVEYGLQFHYISTASVTNLTERESYPALSVRNFPPANDGSNGYIASKWASEVYLEGMNRRYLMPLVIHRPSSITGPGVPETDVMGSLFKYSRQMLAIPRSDYIKGWTDLVSLESAAAKIARLVLRGHQQLEAQFVYESGEVQVRSEDMKQSMEEQMPGETFQELGIEEWVRRAEVLGMNGMVAAFLRGMKDQPLVMTKPEAEIDEEDIESLPECVRKRMKSG